MWLVEKEIKGGNPVVTDDDEIGPGVSGRFAGAARYPLDPSAIAQFLRLGNRLVSKVRMSACSNPAGVCDHVLTSVAEYFSGPWQSQLAAKWRS